MHKFLEAARFVWSLSVWLDDDGLLLGELAPFGDGGGVSGVLRGDRWRLLQRVYDVLRV